MDLDTTEKLTQVGKTLIDQTAARVLVPPMRSESGHWFGGGNMVRDKQGDLWLVGRYRNQGDSRTGLGKGERGIELAVFRSKDGGQTFNKSLAFSKSELSIGGHNVLSIEGSALRLTDHGVELYVSTEKTGIDYPNGLESYLKPSTGVWTIDRIVAESIDQLEASKIETVMQSDDPRFVQVKDPLLGSHQGNPCLMFCTHPYCWTSSNTGFAPLSDNATVDEAVFDFFPRGFTWDVAMTRGTCVLPLPSMGVLEGRDVKLLFYDGGECVRDLEPHVTSVERPRGYSCEELGGLAYYENDDLHTTKRLSIVAPMFISPYGTGCSRYVDVLVTEDQYIATWQQGQSDGSQPLVVNRVPRSEIEALLTL